ncbi:hypothetical protein T484DRAFT_1817050, partial [Baffinella frigidus]
MPNKDAGKIIGKAGATIKAMQSKSGARLKVPSVSDYSPWTEGRVVGISGQTKQIGKAIAAVLQEVSEGSESITAQLLIPEISCGLVRANLKMMEEKSGAKIQLTSQGKQGIQERIVTVGGTIQQ